MAIRVNKISCTALPARVTASLDYVSTKGFAKVEPLSFADPIRVTPVTVSGLRVSSSGSQLEAVYESSCGKLAGTILRSGGENTVEVAMAETSGSGSSASTNSKKCVAGSVTATIPGAVVSEERRFRPYEVTPNDIERAYFVRLAEIKGGSLERKPSGVSLSYLRKCNEAPIGVVVDGQTTKGKLPSSIDLRKVRVGVLVARYYNLVCPESSPAMVEDRIVNRDINIPASTEVTFMGATRNPSTLALREPSQYALIKKKSGRGLMIDFKAGCNKQIGAVYARDEKGNLSVALVERQGDPFQCKAGQDLTLVQPFAGKGPGVAAVYPLKIRRSSDKQL